ncbi:MAG: amidohydrolase family protein [Acidimicrobiales bacterium]
MSLLLRDVEVDGANVDVRVVDGLVAEIGVEVSTDGHEVVDGLGGALIPGLHDHHLHLYSTAAAARSTAVGPAEARDLTGLRDALLEADAVLPSGDWLRAVGYHESVAGDLDRAALDRLVPDRPLRVQHRSGARWMLNSAGIAALDLAGRDEISIERDATGRPTGRLHRADAWLRQLLPAEPALDFASLGASLANVGITGVTDTTPFEHLDELTTLATAVRSGDLPQRVVVTGGPALADAARPAGLEQGPVKLVIDDAAYPSLTELIAHISHAHQHDRSVAIHCVTRTALVLALAAWDAAGSIEGDRVEHGAVVPPELVGGLQRHDLTVVTQPGFIGERGDEYLAEVDRDDLPHLYPCGSLIGAGVRVAGSTDAPFTSFDPWAAMRSAVHRRSPSGATVGGAEAIDPATALRLFLGAPGDPGGPPRTVQVGAPADLCLLDRPLAEVLTRLRSDDVAATICAGRLVTRA